MAHYLSQKKVLITCALVLALLLFWPGGLRLLFSSANEVSYSAGLDFTTCQGFLANESIDSDRCRSDYQISLGNTGKTVQQRIGVTLSPVPATWRLGVSVTDIVASAREKISPQIEYQQLGDTLTFTIDDLHPNRLVYLQLLAIGEEAADLLASSEIAVSANGAIIETNPQLTAIARFFRSLFGIFGM